MLMVHGSPFCHITMLWWGNGTLHFTLLSLVIVHGKFNVNSFFSFYLSLYCTHVFSYLINSKCFFV